MNVGAVCARKNVFMLECFCAHFIMGRPMCKLSNKHLSLNACMPWSHAYICVHSWFVVAEDLESMPACSCLIVRERIRRDVQMRLSKRLWNDLELNTAADFNRVSLHVKLHVWWEAVGKPGHKPGIWNFIWVFFF